MKANPGKLSYGSPGNGSSPHLAGELFKDMAGLCQPRAAYRLVKALKDEVGLPIHFHTHDVSGIQGAAILKGSEAGLDIADAALAAGGRVTGVIPEALMAREIGHTDGDDVDRGVEARIGLDGGLGEADGILAGDERLGVELDVGGGLRQERCELSDLGCDFGGLQHEAGLVLGEGAGEVDASGRCETGHEHARASELGVDLDHLGRRHDAHQHRAFSLGYAGT